MHFGEKERERERESHQQQQQQTEEKKKTFKKRPNLHNASFLQYKLKQCTNMPLLHQTYGTIDNSHINHQKKDFFFN